MSENIQQMFLSVVVVAVAWLYAAPRVAASVEEDQAQCTPQHVHLAYGDSLDQIVILWATKGNCSTLVEYGNSAWKLDQRATGTSEEFWEQNFRGLHNIHRVKLTNLVASMTYFYRPVSNDIGRKPFYFQTPRFDWNWSPNFLVYGDLGVHTQTIPTLAEEVLKGQYSAVLHVGDFAYNLKDSDGEVGDTFLTRIEPVAAYVPYMTCPGNHEIDSDTFVHYRHRFSMPHSPWPIPVDKLWYSFDIGPVHFISYSTEVFFTLNGSLEKTQFDWLVNDLRMANTQRHKRPWIIAFGHRPMYCSAADGDDCTRDLSLVRRGLEDVFFLYGVDIVLQAHEHNYERLYPMYKNVTLSTNYTDPRAPIQIISGAAGSKHGVDPFLMPPKPVWSAVRVENKSLNSFGRLKVVNATHVYWEQQSIHEDSSILDTLWIVQHHHHKFQLDDLPQNISQSVDTSAFMPGLLEKDPEESQKELLAADKSRRIAIGVSFGVLFLMLLVGAVLNKACHRKHYTTVRRWETMDLDYGKRLFTPGKDDDDDLDRDFEIDIGESNSQSRRLLNSH